MLQLLSRCEGMLLNRRVVERIAEALPACGVALSIGLGALGLAKGSVRAVCIVTLAVYVAIGITVSKSPTRQGFHDRSPAAPTSCVGVGAGEGTRGQSDQPISELFSLKLNM